MNHSAVSLLESRQYRCIKVSYNNKHKLITEICTFMTHHLGGKQLERHGPKLCHSRSALQAKPCTQCDCKSVEICIKNLRIYCDFETCLYCWIISGVVLAGPTEILGSEWNLFHSFLRTVSEWNRFHSFPRTVSEWNLFHSWSLRMEPLPLLPPYSPLMELFHSFPSTVSEWNLTRRRRRRRLFTAESVWSTEFPITCSQFKLLGSLVDLKFTAYAGWASSS